MKMFFYLENQYYICNNYLISSMDVDQVQLINDLKANINLLVARLEKEKAENTRLRRTNMELQKDMDMLDSKIKDIEQNYANLKIAKSFVAESGNVHEAKIRVNRIVREIDKCIALLNR